MINYEFKSTSMQETMLYLDDVGKEFGLSGEPIFTGFFDAEGQVKEVSEPVPVTFECFCGIGPLKRIAELGYPEIAESLRLLTI